MTNSENNNSLLPISSNTGDALLEKPASSLGRAASDILEAVFHFALDPIRKYNIQKEINLIKFKQEAEEAIKTIPEENLDDSKIGITLKAVEDSRYQLNNDEIRELFIKLISSSVDNRVNSDIKPLFSSIIADMTPSEAVLLKKMYTNTGSVVPYVEFQTEEKTTYARNSLEHSILLLDNNYILNNNLELSLLENSNLIKLNKGDFLSHPYFETQYNNVNHYIDKFKEFVDTNKKNIVMEKSHYSFTPLGKALCKILFEKI